MKSKKNITLFLILVLVLQLLPVKQAINYFLINNQITEEIVELNKSAINNINPDHEDPVFLYEFQFASQIHTNILNTALEMYHQMVPSSHAVDIETPPPNTVIS